MRHAITDDELKRRTYEFIASQPRGVLIGKILPKVLGNKERIRKQIKVLLKEKKIKYIKVFHLRLFKATKYGQRKKRLYNWEKIERKCIKSGYNFKARSGRVYDG